ncbi:MAG: hypothetical protein P4L83_12000 [Nevskia sp.]|nr:hypothetical protein [Nevskia sp.]
MAEIKQFPTRKPLKRVEATVDRIGGYEPAGRPGLHLCIITFAEFPDQPLTVPARYPAVALTRPGDKVSLLANEPKRTIHFQNTTVQMEALIVLRVAA